MLGVGQDLLGGRHDLLGGGQVLTGGGHDLLGGGQELGGGGQDLQQQLHGQQLGPYQGLGRYQYVQTTEEDQYR